MSGVELILAFLAGVVLGGALDLGVTDYTFTLTAHAKAHGWDAAFGAGDQSISIGQSGRGERI